MPARLEPVPPDAAMDALLHQHFTRDRHSGDVLDVMAVTLQALPVWRLSYADLADAVACLMAGLAGWPAVPETLAPPVRFRLADFAASSSRPGDGAPLMQRAGVVARMIGDGLYLADPEGRAIHRMDPLAAAIWDLLDSPATADEVADLLAEAFPEADRAQLLQDVRGLLSSLVAAGLVG